MLAHARTQSRSAPCWRGCVRKLVTPAHRWQTLASPGSLINTDCLAHTHDEETFAICEHFLDEAEQHTLLKASLKRLDTTSDASEYRTKRRQHRAQARSLDADAKSSLFLPKECYGFHSGHFDGVISGYRETTVSRFDDPFDANERTTLLAVLKKIYVALGASDESVGFEPPTHLLMHLLHLSSSGRIDPHVDNIEASGGLLAGLSLGSERVMHLERSKDDAFSVLLPPGSLYIQRGTVRFDYKHSIPAEDTWQSRLAGGQQRVSLMLRDRLKTET